ncbi:MAG: hypothetical protein IJ587_10365 [Synergistaceae bacterium]|nr:hypothetical protein [Synergistaceae bacterium]
MNRTDRINAIIKQRKPLAENIQNIRSNISKITASFEKMLPVCGAALNDESLAPEFNGLSEILEACSKSINELHSLRGDLSLLQNRFSRDTLDIAVIGRARQGKSRLLQTITGLGSEEIPDGNQAFCTGVRSDIINNSNLVTAYAQVNFLTEKQFIDERIAPYFKDLQEYKPDLFTPMSVYDFQSMKLPETVKASPEAVTQMNLHLQHLRDLQEHLPQYREYLGQSPMKIKRSQIREYVAQDNENGERIFFKHMAVANVEIFCKFPNSDVGKLRLIDLPGLGDTRKGDAEQLVRALSDEVDLVFFLSKPSNTGAGWQDNEISLYSQARRALGDKLPIERWSFWVFNRDSRDGANNLTQCELLRNSIASAQIKVADTVIADCADSDEVNSKLVDKALDFLTANIERNDADYAARLQDDVSKAVSQLNDNIVRVLDITREGRDSDDDADMFDSLFAKLWRQLRAAIQSCVGKGSDLRNAKNTPCAPLRERIEGIFTEAEHGNNFTFSEEDIREKYNEYGDTVRVYPECLHILRTELGNRMQEDMDDILNGVMTDMKDKFGKILGQTGRLEGKFGCADHELLGRISSYIRENNYADRFPTILHGLELLDGWKLNYRSFAQHRIREALNCLDPLDDANISQGVPHSETEVLDLLQDLYEQAIYEMRKKFDGPNGIYPEPNNAAFAIAEEFKDIMIRSGNDEEFLKMEWKRLYRPIRGDVWPEDFGKTQRKRDVSAAIRGHAEEISRMLQDFRRS